MSEHIKQSQDVKSSGLTIYSAIVRRFQGPAVAQDAQTTQPGSSSMKRSFWRSKACYVLTFLFLIGIMIMTLLLVFLGPSAPSLAFSPLRPPAIPLAVRSPYLNVWLQGNGGELAGATPKFWNGKTMDWTGMISVDGCSYAWMGEPETTNGTLEHVKQLSFEYTASRSIFTMSVADKISMTVTFLSPVEPEDLKRASLPSSYMDIEVTTTDGKAHDVALYTDIAAEWTSGSNQSIVAGEYQQDVGGSISSHRFYRSDQPAFTETNDTIEDGYWYYTARSSPRLTWQAGATDIVRDCFVQRGSLENKTTVSHNKADQSTVFAFAIDLGSVDSISKSALFLVSHLQDDPIQFLGASNSSQPLSALWRSYFTSHQQVLSFAYNDYDTASARADTTDKQINDDSCNAGGDSYAALTTLAARQAFGSLIWAGNESQPLLFMKEISSDGNVNTVDVIFPFHPIAIYLNPQILRYLIDPIFINQESGHWPNAYTMHDIGSHFPNATGHQDGMAEEQPLEECGNMLIMTLAYAQRANDQAYLKKHYNSLKEWTGYLVNDSLIPADQISTDDFAGSLANQTNLAVKGMIGIAAMAQIATEMNQTEDAMNYSSIAKDYINKWQDLGITHDANGTHTTLAYGLNKSYGLLYNIFADKELNLGLVPQSVYDMQSDFYARKLTKYGVPLDSRHNYTKADWEIFAAAVASTSTKHKLIDAVAKYVADTPIDLPFVDLYDTRNAQFPNETGAKFINRPVVGGMFALLALPKSPG